MYFCELYYMNLGNNKKTCFLSFSTSRQPKNNLINFFMRNLNILTYKVTVLKQFAFKMGNIDFYNMIDLY